MNEIRINDPLHHHLAKKRPVHIIGGLHHDEHEAALKATTPDFVLPPLNTHINFLKYTQSYSDQDHLDLHLRFTASDHDIEPPEVYDWRFVYPADDANRKAQKKNIMPPDNQYLCGSCWAISTASVIGDAFVAAGLVDWRPEISTTWALTCYPQGKCDGGSPALLLQDIARGSGIPSKHCLDYSFCAKNEKCNGQAVQHFQAQNLSSLVPQECACYYGGDVQHYNYLINKDIKTLAIGQGATTAENMHSAIKKHILLHGPVLTGYFVMRNFSSGYFTKINGGVYLERANYIPGSSLTFNDAEVSGQNYKGSHAVAIIGWGVAKNILYDNNKKGDVPFWYCRNSWGPNWGGDSGYFKMAMYPFNKVAQFGKIVDIVDSQGQRHRCGGIVTFTVVKPPQKTTFKTLSNKPPQLLQNEDYYKKTEEGYKPDGTPQPPPSTPPGGGPSGLLPVSSYFSTEDILLYLVLPAFVIFLIIMVVKIIKTNEASL
jgi:hypothetical protein